jgi:hypothetical protein
MRAWFLIVLPTLIIMQMSPSSAQKRDQTASVHILVVDGTGQDLGKGVISSFMRISDSQEFSSTFHDNSASPIPYGIYHLKVFATGFYSAERTVQVFGQDVWVVIALAPGGIDGIDPPTKVSGTVFNVDPREEPVYLRMSGVYSDFLIDTKLKVTQTTGKFDLTAVIPMGKYVLLTVGRTHILDMREVDVPSQSAISIDLHPSKSHQ